MKQMKALFTIAVTTLLVMSCKAQAQSIATATGSPTETATATAKPASTLKPTQAVTSIPGWVTDFAEPILKAIENQTPRFQDDFSNRNSNWIIGKQGAYLGPATALPTPDPGKHNAGETGYIDGEYFTTANPNSCYGGVNSRVGEYQDFVAEFDARFFSGVDGEWQLQFHGNRSGLYTLSITENSDYTWIQKCVSGMPTECGEVARSTGNAIKSGVESNHMTLIVRGERIGVYANGTPVLYTEDKHFSEKFKTGIFSLSVCNTGTVPVEIRWDNLKLWDISNLP